MEGLKGMQVDRITGRPIENLRLAKEAEEQKRLESFVIEGIAAEKELATEGGKTFISHMLKLLDNEFDEFAAQSQRVQTILDILGSYGVKISAGRRAAERLTKLRLRMDPNMSLGSTE